ncbi:MAG: alpha/beta fold hydrolase [Marmoricola sp.]
MGPGNLEVTSADGTILGIERMGDGPALVAVHGTTADRSRWEPVHRALADAYTVYFLDRRGRGGSLNEAEGEYTLRREVEDVQAVLDFIGGPAYYLGHSYGALVGIEVLASGAPVVKALLYEPPFDAGGHHVIPPPFIDRYADLIRAEQRAEALDLFYREVIGVDPEPLHALPIWQARRLAAHTLVREARVAESYVPDKTVLRNVEVPTLVLTGSDSPPAFGAAARLAVEALPHAELVVADGHGHAMIDADPEGFAELVRGFLR